MIAFDQSAKYAIIHHCMIGESIKILPFLNFTLNYNTGAAFGVLSTESGWQIYFFAALSLAIATLLIAWLIRIRRSDYVIAIGLSLVIGGALGNLIDRIRLGYIVDFIDFHIKDWHYATYNLSDTAICIGTFLLMIHIVFIRKQ
ncbi:Lipoprotein signal peptidase [Coxiella endosymbiont of Amblyomma nuttalli]|nr:Lipoprotein signal peptidase [Coxiella endosymbiont of Amblyomma nuttalli]